MADTTVSECVGMQREINVVDDEFSVTLNLSEKVNSNGDDVRVGSFVGSKGLRIKTLLGKSKGRYLKEVNGDDTLSAFRMQVKVDDSDDSEKVFRATWPKCEGCSDLVLIS